MDLCSSSRFRIDCQGAFNEADSFFHADQTESTLLSFLGLEIKTAAEVFNLQMDFALCEAELDTCFAGARLFRNILQALLCNPIETERNVVRN